jgi:cytochrome c peroxidase
MKTGAALVLAALLAGPALADGSPGVAPDFTEDEKALILSQGPWPMATAPDPSNRFSGRADAVAFGRMLFESPALSKDGDRACSTCHMETQGFADGLPRGIGIARVDRNTPGLFNQRLNRWYGWDGKSDNLWAQSIAPMLDARELAVTAEEVKTRVAGDPALAAGYGRVAGAAVAERDAETVMVDVAKMMAAYQETIVSGRTAFDDFRDAVEHGDAAAVARYPAEAQRGLKLFLGRGQCVLCHFGPNFTNAEFHDIGLPHFPEPGRVDPGRYGGVKKLRASRYNLLGPFSDDAGRTTAGFTRHVRLIPRQWGEFRVPSLRNVKLTAPYMHDGSKATLTDVVKHYSEIDEERLHQDGEKLLKPLHLSEREIADLVAFLRTL